MNPLRALYTVLIHHKWLIFWEGLRLGLPLPLLLLHDWSKILPDELLPMCRSFRLDSNGKYYWEHSEEQKKFQELHWSRNKHHWQRWVRKGIARKIPDIYIREMVADWRAVGLDPGNIPLDEWYGNNRGKIILHPDSRRRLESLLAEGIGRTYETQT